jgi:hypothetical protein
MPRGARPGERRGGRAKGTPNKQSIPAIKAAIIREEGPRLDSIELKRMAAAMVLGEIRKLAGEKYDPEVLIDWCLKLGWITDGYIANEYPRVSPVEPEERNDYNVEVRADLSRLNAEQLIALKHLALIASGGSTTTPVSGSPSPPVRRTDHRKAGQRGTRKDRP